MKIVTMFLLMTIFSCKLSTNLKVKPANFQPLNAKGCLSQYAMNYNHLSNIEDGSCEFKYCADASYANYEPKVHSEVLEYIEKFGLTHNNSNRVQNFCAGEKLFCKHPESLNYKEGPYPIEGYTKEYCYFRACNKTDYQGYEKYQEYQEYLKTNEGEISIDNSQKYCQAREIFHDTISIEPEVKNSKFNEAAISFILDDSGSMRDEIESVKLALIELAPKFQAMKKDITLSFHRMSDIEHPSERKPANAYPLEQVTPDLFKYAYGLPLSIGNVLINPSKSVAQINQEITQVLGNFQIKQIFGQEQGLCLTLKHLNDLKNKGFKDKKQYVSVVITDEDEQYRNNSKKCYSSFLSDEFLEEWIEENITFKDNQQQEKHIESFVDSYQALPISQQESYGWMGLFYDKNNSSCDNGEKHGETYIDFANALKSIGANVQTADICASNYTSIIRDKLIDGFLDEVPLKFLLITNQNSPIVNEVRLKFKNGNQEVMTPNLFTISREGDDFYINLNESLKDQIKLLQLIEVDITYKK